MCECYTIGKFISEDPDCPVHGTEAQREREEQEEKQAALHRIIQGLVDKLNFHVKDQDAETKALIGAAQAIMRKY